MDSPRCPTCGGPLTGGPAAPGRCPACLLELGLSAPGEEPAESPADADPDREPATIGPYRILGRLGEGGMGIVYLAEQTAPVRRRVALKVVKRGIGGRDVIRRFEAERQALARMDHPSIARVYDAGETPDGLPYFAMEYVDGAPITAHCDDERLGLRERLELLTEVCAAVQHAHHKGVIHRDLKPSNVLIARLDGRAVPKVIDFGVAKAIEKHLTERTLFTELGMIVGTPEYMSPEQAEFTGERVDTRTDVYSLGVLQYELMTGALPFDPEALRAGGFEQICRRIREEEPSRPSARVGAAGDAAARSARLRRLDAATLRRQLSGDLDWVTMKALEKDPERRYRSPQDLADDLRRYLRHEPVLAGPPSAAYRLRKFVRRNRLVVASATAVLLAVLAGAVAATTFAVREAAERRRTERARADLEKVVAFQARMISEVEPEPMGRRLLEDLRRRIREAAARDGASAAEVEALTGRLDPVLEKVNGTDAALRVLHEEILARAARVIESEFADQPLIEARLRLSLAETYRQIGLYDRGRPHIERALELRRRALGEEHPDTLRALTALAGNHLIGGRYEESEAAYRRAIEGLRRALGPDAPDTLDAVRGLGGLLRRQGRYDEAEPLLLQTLETLRRTLGPQALPTIDTSLMLAIVYGFTGRHDRARPLLAEAVEVRTRVLGPEHHLTLSARSLLAANAANRGRLAEAETLYLSLVETQRRVLGSEHRDVAVTLNSLGGVYVSEHRLDDAEAAFRGALEIAERQYGPDHLYTISMTMNLASVLQASGRLQEAAALDEEGLAKMERAVGPGHPSTLTSRCNLGIVYHLQGRHREAAREFRAAADHPRATAAIKRQAAQFFLTPAPSRDAALAERYAAEAVEMTGRQDVVSLAMWAKAVAGNGRIAEAGSIWEEAVALPKAGPTQFNDYAWFLLTRAADDPASGPTALDYALKAVEPPGDRNPDHLDTLALAYHRTGEDEKAVETVERALALVAPDDAARRAPFLERLEQYRAALKAASAR